MGLNSTLLTCYVSMLLKHCKVHIGMAIAITATSFFLFNSVVLSVVLAASLTKWVIHARHDKPAAKLENLDETIPSGVNLPTEEKILVVGAGFVGLGAASALRRRGIPFDVVENDDAIGGNWHHGVYETVHLISSKKTTELREFPMPKEYPHFPSYVEMRNYLHTYTEHFQLRPHIQLQTKVVKLTPLNGPTGNGDKWQVDMELADGKTSRKIYKGILICTGHHWNSRIPSYKGQSNFAGEIIHSKQYRTPKQLVGKRVLVVGGGNSACDVAVEASRFAERSHLSVRRGYWFVPRTFFGIPLPELLSPYVPNFIGRVIAKCLMYVSVGKLERYGLPCPDHEPFDVHPTINSSLLATIHLGGIKVQKDIDSFPGGKTVKFKDGNEEEVDMVVFATGFYMDIPVLGNLVEYNDGVPQLLNNMLVPGYRNIYSMLVEQVRYGLGPIVSTWGQLIGDMIEEQDKCKNNIVDLMTKLGGTMPSKTKGTNDIVQDPFMKFRHCNLAAAVVPHLHQLEDELMVNPSRKAM